MSFIPSPLTKGAMLQENALSQIAYTESVPRQFKNYRTDPELPQGYLWPDQKEQYCPRRLLDYLLPGPIKLTHKFGYVFCHRGLHERASGIVENSVAAIDNGIDHGLFLHEVDSFVLEQLDKAFIAHDKIPRRVTSKSLPWESYPIGDILDTRLVTRRVEREAKNSDLTSKESEFASSYVETDGKIPSLFDMMWRESQKLSGITLQIDLREEDFAKAIAYYSYHISKMSLLYDDSHGVHQSKAWGLFRSTILKGYNKHYKTFEDLHTNITKMSMEAYGEDFFEIRHLHVCPPLILVFSASHLVNLAKAATPTRDPQGGRKSYEKIRLIFLDQVSSFVNVGVGRYNFILEIAHSGLGLHYDIDSDTARNPLDGTLLTDYDVIVESRVDRAMIEVSLELRKNYPDLLFASCTRLPDVITSKGKYKASFATSRLELWSTGEKGLASKLRAMHGGLYPQCQVVIADDPGSEIAARTWIDQKSGLDRSKLLYMTYNEWLATASNDVVAAITKINNQDFMPNRAEDSTALGLSDKKRQKDMELQKLIGSWLKTLLSPQSTPILGGNQYNVGKFWRSDESKITQRIARNQHSVMSDDDGKYDDGVSLLWEKRRRGHFSGNTSSDPIILRIMGEVYRFDNVTDVKESLASIAAYKAAYDGNEQVVKTLVATGVNIDACAGDYGTMLAAASARGHGAIVEFLLNKGADMTLGTRGTPLGLAAAAGNTDVVGKLVSALKPKQAHYDISWKLGNALLLAANAGHEPVVLLLLENGADVNFRSSRTGLTALQKASKRQSEGSLIDLLVAKGAKVDVPEASEHGSALEQACHSGDLYVTKLLLSKGAVVDFPLRRSHVGEPMVTLLEKYETKESIAGRSIPENATRRSIARDRRDPVRKILGSGFSVTKRRKPPAAAEVQRIDEPRQLRDCGCLLCFVDQKRQPSTEYQIEQSLRSRFMNRKKNKVTVEDPVSITLDAMGKLDFVDRPKGKGRVYTFDHFFSTEVSGRVPNKDIDKSN